MALVSAGFAALTTILAMSGFPDTRAQEELAGHGISDWNRAAAFPPLAACRPPSYGKYLACTYVASLALT